MASSFLAQADTMCHTHQQIPTLIHDRRYCILLGFTFTRLVVVGTLPMNQELVLETFLPFLTSLAG